jgi:hypothetical protein
MGQHHLPHQSCQPSIACGICGNDMMLAYVDPTGTNTVYACRCDDGHHHEILRADQSAPSEVGLNLSGACVAAERRAGEVMAVRRGKEGEPLKARADQRVSFTRRLVLTLREGTIALQRRSHVLRRCRWRPGL